MEIRPEDFLTSGVGVGMRVSHSLSTSAKRSARGVLLRLEPVCDGGKTRSKGTSSPNFLRSLSIFCLRRVFKDVMLEFRMAESHREGSSDGMGVN